MPILGTLAAGSAQGFGFAGFQKPSGPPPGIVTTGLVLYLDAGKHASYPGTGSTWHDLSGNGNDATCVNSPAFADGNTFILNGTDQYFTLPAAVAPTGASAFSYSAWFNYTHLGNAGNPPYGFGILDGNNLNTFQFFVTGATSPSGPANLLTFAKFGDYLTGSASYTFYPGTWYNVCGTNTGTQQEFYVNGVLIGSTNISDSYTNSTLNVMGGGYLTNYSGYFAGQFPIITGYNAVLTSAQVLQNFNADRSRFGV